MKQHTKQLPAHGGELKKGALDQNFSGFTRTAGPIVEPMYRLRT